jgi:hypothetical protein
MQKVHEGNRDKIVHMDFTSMVITAAIAGGGAFLGSYLKKKGENLATKEDIEDLRKQTATLTQTTEGIKARISIDLWSRQQRWDVQKSALLDTLKELASSEALLFAAVYTFQVTKGSESPEAKEQRKDANEQYFAAIRAFWRTKLAMEIVCGKEIADQFQDIDRLMAMTARKMKDGDFGGVWTHYEEIQTAKIQLGNLIRKQLEFDAVPLTLDPVNLGEFKSLVGKSQ